MVGINWNKANGDKKRFAPKKLRNENNLRAYWYYKNAI